VTLRQPIRFRAVPRSRLRLNSLLLVELVQLPGHVLPTTIMPYTLLPRVCLRLAPDDLPANLSSGVTLAVQQAHACIAGCLIHHSSEVEPRQQLAQVHMYAVQHAHKFRRAAWVQRAPHLTHHTGLADLLLTGLHEGGWTHRTAIEHPFKC
jgi:hypothetical protein